jgi:DnaJ-class molecular chaperone
MGGATMPSAADLPAALAELATCQAFELPNRGFDDSVTKLIALMDRILRTGQARQAPDPHSTAWRKRWSEQQENRRKEQERERERERVRKARADQPVDLRYDIEVTLEEAVEGCAKVIVWPGRRVTIQVPAGIGNGQRLRLGGQGQPSPNGRRVGDLYVVAHIREHPIYQRDGDDLHTTIRVDAEDLVRGATVTLPRLGNRLLEVDIPPHTPDRAVLRVQGKGVTHVSGWGAGDLYVTVERQEPLFDRVQDIFG